MLKHFAFVFSWNKLETMLMQNLGGGGGQGQTKGIMVHVFSEVAY